MNYTPGNISFLRKKNNLTQSEIHDRLGVKPNTWSNWENGVSEPNIENLLIISNFFGVSISNIIEDDLSDGSIPVKPGGIRNYKAANSIVHAEEPQEPYANTSAEYKSLRNTINLQEQLIKAQAGQIDALQTATNALKEFIEELKKQLC